MKTKETTQPKEEQHEQTCREWFIMMGVDESLLEGMI